MYAEVAVNAAVKNTFHYHIPPALHGDILPGHLVRVSFGTSTQHGIVVALHTESPIAHTKPIAERLDRQPVVTLQQIALARWMSARYLAPIGMCLWLMLPPGMTERDVLLTLLDPHTQPDDPLQQQLIALLKRRGPLRGKQVQTALKASGWQEAAAALHKSAVLRRESVISPPRVRPKVVQTAALAIHPDQIPQIARHLGKASRRADLLEVIAALDDDAPLVSDVLRIAGSDRATLKRLAETGMIALLDDQPARVMLEISPEAVPDALLTLRGGQRLLHVLQVLAREAEPIDVSWVYAQTGAKLADLRRLEEDGLLVLGQKQTWRDSLATREFFPAVPPPLTPEQRAAWEMIEARIKAWMWGDTASQPGAFLLHGVTGSGKTEIYLRAVQLTLAQGRQAIFLVPEIALTAQTVQRVAARFPGKVAVVHSALSPGERYDTWQRARTGLIQVVIGTRSALFTPLPDAGLVILDEEHDHSYKQSPPVAPPYYDARRAAEEMMRQNNGVLILGSATPDVTTYYRAQRGDLVIVRLPNRIMGHRAHISALSGREAVTARYFPADAEDALMIDLPPVALVDMRQELKSGNTGMFSRALQDALRQCLSRGEQAILFLNRRGQATYVFCRDCGYIAKCPRCDTPLTYHREGEALRCHHCGHKQAAPQTCPQCASKRIKYFGAGTQQVEAELKLKFPAARVLRWDADTAATPEAHEAILAQFVQRQADIMVGTQMVAKGLDLPLVTVVGVVSADLGLALPDFRAGERTFQLLAQVAGRAGRGLLGGQVILQTYEPEHYAVSAAATHDYASFYKQEIEMRRALGHPPFRRLTRIIFAFTSAAKARDEALRAAGVLRERIAALRSTGVELIGPAPCFFGKIDKYYRWHLLLRGEIGLEEVDIARGWHVDIDPVDVL